MHKKSITAALAAASAALVVGSLGMAGTAHADPASQKTYNAVGSNTTQDVIAALAGQTISGASVSYGSGTLSNVGSYEATGSATIEPITPEPNSADNGAFTRPNGSGSGVAALSASVDTATPLHTFDGKTIVGEVQFSRSSSAPSTSGTDLDYVPFARDAVGYIYVGSTAAKIGSLSLSNLTKIYEGQQPISGVTITPYLPQSGSGTRAFFQKIIGVPNSSLGSDVNQSSTNEENTASVIGNLSSGSIAIYPFSISSYIAQYNGYAADTGISKVNLGHPDGVNPVSAGSGSNIAPNTSFYNSPSVYGRDVYNVFKASEVTAYEGGTSDNLLKQFVVSPTVTTPTINSAASKTIITDFGFLTVSYSGVVSGTSSKTLGGAYTFTP